MQWTSYERHASHRGLRSASESPRKVGLAIAAWRPAFIAPYFDPDFSSDIPQRRTYRHASGPMDRVEPDDRGGANVRIHGKIDDTNEGYDCEHRGVEACQDGENKRQMRISSN